MNKSIISGWLLLAITGLLLVPPLFAHHVVATKPLALAACAVDGCTLQITLHNNVWSSSCINGDCPSGAGQPCVLTTIFDPATNKYTTTCPCGSDAHCSLIAVSPNFIFELATFSCSTPNCAQSVPCQYKKHIEEPPGSGQFRWKCLCSSGS